MDKRIALKQGTGTRRLFHGTNYKLTVEANSALLSLFKRLPSVRMESERTLLDD